MSLLFSTNWRWRWRCRCSATTLKASSPSTGCSSFSLSSKPKPKPSSFAFFIRSRPTHRLSSPVARTFALALSGGAMDGGRAPTLYPLHRCKTIHLVRHAQGIHNVEGDKNYQAYMSPKYLDAQVTELGWQQIDNLRRHVHACGLSKRIELVISSPLMRTMQTAVGVFGGEGYTDGMDAVPLMVANAGNSHRAAISSVDSPPIIAVEQCREHLGVHPCDRRRSISEYEFLFPAVDFSLIESDEDTLWKADVRETKEDLQARGSKFLNWLWSRNEKEIAIVTHSGYLFHTLTALAIGYPPEMKKEICKHFANCELRSMVIVDNSMIGSDTSMTNYPGKIPPGPDLPSASLDNKAENGEVAANSST